MKTKAFTLIEIIIVITIIGIITAVAVLSYRGAYERQQVSVFSKDLLATAQHAKAEVKAGKKDADGLLCEGIYFEVDAVPQKVSMSYVEDPDSAGVWKCDLANPNNSDLDQSSKNILVDAITVADTTAGPITLLFVPPSGEMKVYDPNDLTGDLLVIFHRDNYDDLDFDFGVESGADRIYVKKHEEI